MVDRHDRDQYPMQETTASPSGVWTQLECHFVHHARLVDRFRNVDRLALARMWQLQGNEFGRPLTKLERDALVERYCEVFGHWPPGAA
jgi:hypothetical protein